MEWISIIKKEPDLNRIHLLVDGNSIFLSGTTLQPFFVQLCGEMKPIGSLNFTHWMPLPSPPDQVPDAGKMVKDIS